jgi:hypothetical protein
MMPIYTLENNSTKLHLYEIKDNYLLLVINNQPYIIYLNDKWIGRPSDYRNQYIKIFFNNLPWNICTWPKNTYDSNPLGDPVKGDEKEKYLFTKYSIEVNIFIHKYNNYKNLKIPFKSS